MERLLKRGAEANLYSTDWFGKSAISKVRVRKTYRKKELDDSIRAQRTIREASMIARAKHALVSVPVIYLVDPKHGEIIMEEIVGQSVKDVLDKDVMDVKIVSEEIGSMIGKLHKSGIIHGDLTTSNMIMREERIYFIDFGLSLTSDRMEDMGVDLRLLKGVLSSAHSKVFRRTYKGIISSYGKVMGSSMTKNVLEVVEQIERRGRYARVE